MIQYIQQQQNQSIYDLCNQAYGTLDLLVRFCQDNGVTDMDNIPQQKLYSYDTTLVKNQNAQKYPYATDNLIVNRVHGNEYGLEFN